MGAHRAPEPEAPYRADIYTPTIYPTGTTYAEPPAPPTQYTPPVQSIAPQYSTSGTQRPSAVPVVLFTVLFGIFGSISAARRAKKAKAAGGTGTPYWITFAITLVAVVAAQFVLLAMVIAQAKVATPDKLEHSIVAGGGNPRPTAASCAEDGVHANGSGRYQCTVGFADGTRGSYTIIVNDDGRWLVTP